MVTGRKEVLEFFKNEKKINIKKAPLKHNEYSNSKNKDDFNIRSSCFQKGAETYLKELNNDICYCLSTGDHSNSKKNKKIFLKTENFIYAVKLTYRILESEYPSEMINHKNRSKVLFALQEFNKKPDFFSITENEKKIVDSLLLLYKEEKEPVDPPVPPEVLF